MEPIILRQTSEDGMPLEAVFLPEAGMNLMSYKKGNIEIIDQSTREQFEERRSGLGPLIGPHFHRKRAAVVPQVKEEHLFPHIARVKAKGIQDPFSHGISRYAPWKAEATSTKVEGVLSGRDLWNGVPLSELEGQDFKMTFSAELLSSGLSIRLSIVSQTDSLVGIHYYYHLPDGAGQIESQVRSNYLDQGQSKLLHPGWVIQNSNAFTFDLAQAADYTFYPYPNVCRGNIRLKTSSYILDTEYESISEESGWQLYRPAGASYVCIEPLTAQDPHHPNLTVSALKIRLSIH